MASELRVNTLKDASGNNSIATSFVAGGSAKSWNFINTSFSVQDSLNVSSCTDESGSSPNTWTINMTSAISNSTYAVSGNARTAGTSPRNIGVSAETTTSYFVSCIVSNAPSNSTIIVGGTIVHGDLA